MFQEDIALVKQIVREEIAKALAEFKLPKAVTPKPVEIDIDGIVKKVLDKIKVTPAVAAEAPKKGKEK